VHVEATIANKNYKLIPGMFTSVIVVVDKPKAFLTLPQTAITFNPYGETVFVVKDIKNSDTKDKDLQDKKSENKALNKKIVTQVFITTGETRDDQIQVLTGIKEGETVVTSGQLKLRNDATVEIKNDSKVNDSPLNKDKEPGKS
jgi:membrane fusion protein (multidrug efflux system)